MALEALHAARVEHDEAKQAAHKALLTALAAGHTYSEVATAAGITRQRVHQIVRGQPSHTAGIPRSEYTKLHYAVERERGKPNLCDKCGTTEAKRYDWANLTGDYNNTADYKRLCRACHAAHDAARRRRAPSLHS